MKLTSRQALLLRAFAVWTVYVWGNRIWNIWTNPLSPQAEELGFKVVHTVLAVVSVAFAGAAWVVVGRNRRSRPAVPTPEGDAAPELTAR